MSRWLPIGSAPRNGIEIIDLWLPTFGRVTDCWWDTLDGCWNISAIEEPTHFMYRPEPPDDPSDTDDIDAQLSPESLADVQAGRAVCRALFTGLAEVASLESLKPKE